MCVIKAYVCFVYMYMLEHVNLYLAGQRLPQMVFSYAVLFVSWSFSQISGQVVKQSRDHYYLFY